MKVKDNATRVYIHKVGEGNTPTECGELLEEKEMDNVSTSWLKVTCVSCIIMGASRLCGYHRRFEECK
jgi:hypothetical protein